MEGKTVTIAGRVTGFRGQGKFIFGYRGWHGENPGSRESRYV